MRIRGIKLVVVRKRGREYRYYYHRKTGKRIEAVFGTAAFALEVAALDTKAVQKTPRDGSLHGLIAAYRASHKFTDLAQSTKSDYQRVFDWLHPIIDAAASEIDTPFVYALQQKAFDQHKRRFANYVVQVLSLVFQWGHKPGLVSHNPARGVELIERPKKMPRANRPWTDDEREAVLSRSSISVQAMVALGMFAGLREGDACTLLKSAYDGSKIETIASKNDEPLWIPAHFRLREILAEAGVARRDGMATRAKRRKVLPFDPPTLVVNSRGTAWTESGFRASFSRLRNRLESEGKVGPGLTFHGLRHTMGKLVIEAGGSKEDVGMILGDRSAVMAAFYSREHDKKGRNNSTMQKLEQTERARMEKQGKENGKP